FVAVLLIALSTTNSVTSAYPVSITPTPSNPQGGTYAIEIPAVLNFVPPPASQSLYVQDFTYFPDSNNTIFNLGHDLCHDYYLAGNSADHLVILDFGYPVSTSTAVGTYILFISPTVFASTSDIRQAVTQFSKGYFLGTSTNLIAHLRIVVGTNNCC